MGGRGIKPTLTALVGWGGGGGDVKSTWVWPLGRLGKAGGKGAGTGRTGHMEGHAVHTRSRCVSVYHPIARHTLWTMPHTGPPGLYPSG